MERLRDVEVVRRRDEPVRAVVVGEVTVVDEHAHDLHGIEGNAFRALDYLIRDEVRKTPRQTAQELAHLVVTQGGKMNGGEAPLFRSPRRAALHELLSCEGHDQDGAPPRPLENVLDEVEQTRVGPLQVLEEEHGRAAVRDALEEDSPCGEEFLSLASCVCLEPQQMKKARFDPASLAGIADVPVEHCDELGPGRCLIALSP